MTELYDKNLVAVVAGSSHKLALASDGTIYAWGSNWAGQLGDNSTTDLLVPVIVDTTDGVSGNQLRCVATNLIGAVASNAALLTVTTATIAPGDAVISFTVE